jgi:hypothetical protein
MIFDSGKALELGKLSACLDAAEGWLAYECWLSTNSSSPAFWLVYRPWPAFIQEDMAGAAIGSLSAGASEGHGDDAAASEGIAADGRL